MIQRESGGCHGYHGFYRGKGVWTGAKGCGNRAGEQMTVVYLNFFDFQAMIPKYSRGYSGCTFKRSVLFYFLIFYIVYEKRQDGCLRRRRMIPFLYLYLCLRQIS